MTERGLFLGRFELDDRIAAIANDARVVIHTIQAGGNCAPENPYARNPHAPMRGGVPKACFAWQDRWAVESLSNISEFTGGIASRMAHADVGLGRIDDATRFNYLLGYVPADPTWDGRYRRITVRVSRPGATVLYRHGYHASPQLVPIDPGRFMTFSRIATAGNHTTEIRDIQVALDARVARDGDGAAHVAVDLRIDASRIQFDEQDGARTASLEVAIFCGADDEDVVGESWQNLDLHLTAESFRRAGREGILHSARVGVKAAPRYVKAIVYDKNADVLGTAMVRIR